MTSFTKHRNLEKPDATTVNKYAVYNSDLDKLETGYQFKALAKETVAAYRAVRMDEATGEVLNATAGTSAVGVTNTSAAASGAEVFVTVQGVLTNTGWAWIPGALVYVHETTPGGLTQTPTVEVIGRALSATELLVYPPNR